MCSLGDDADASSSFIPKKEVPVGTTCIKCREAPSIIILRSKDAYCKECFLKGTIHKFKSLLGKHKLIKPNDKVLVIYDGSESATAMLHFIRTGLNLDNPKRLKFDPFIVFIEPDNTKLTCGENRKEKLNELATAVAIQGFPLHFTSWTDYLENSLTVRIFDCYTDYLDRTQIKKDEKSRRFDSGANLSDKNLLNQHLSRELYIKLAEKFDCKFCFTSELSIDIAESIITNIAFGRGGLLPMDVGVYDNRDSRIIIRPMRQLDLNEVQFYNNLNGLKSVDLHEYQPTVMSTYDSIQNLVHNFVGGLQMNYPATVNTIVRTSDKLGLTKSISKDTICKLCQCPIEISVDILSSIESTNFSHVASTESNINIGNILYKNDFETEYCFSCRKLSENVTTSK